MNKTGQENRTIALQALFLLIFSAVFMFVFYIERWYPNGHSNMFLALGFGGSVGLPFFINSHLLGYFIQRRRSLFSKWWFKLTLHFLSIYACILLYSALTNTLIYDWQQFMIIFLVMVFIGILPSLLFFYYRKYQLYQISFQDVKVENAQLKDSLLAIKRSTDIQLINIPIRNGNYSLDVQDFYFAESDKNYLKLTFDSQETVQIRTTMKQFLAACHQAPNIIQIHRAYAINLDHFNRFQSGVAYIDRQNIQLPISKSFRPEIIKLLEA